MTQMLNAPDASVPFGCVDDSKAILLPSGDQTGEVLCVVLNLVIGLAPVPSALTTQMFVAEIPVSLPSRAWDESKAIFLPSGDHAGSKRKFWFETSFVSAVAPLPSALTTQTFKA